MTTRRCGRGGGRAALHSEQAPCRAHSESSVVPTECCIGWTKTVAEVRWSAARLEFRFMGSDSELDGRPGRHR